MSIRAAEAKYLIPKSTLWNTLQRERNGTVPYRRIALNDSEEQAIMNLMIRGADRGVPLTRKDLSEAAEIVISTLPVERKKELPFRNNRPGIRWVHAFYTRHKQELRYAVPDPQEARRFAATNGKTLAMHFSAMEALVAEFALDDERIWNLDETGCSRG